MNTETKENFISDLLEALTTASESTDYGITSFDTGVTQKVNEGPREYITARYDDGIGCSPILYADNLFDEFQNSEISITRMAERVLAKMQTAHNAMPIPGIPDLSPETAQDHLVFQLINTKENKELLSKCAHIDLEDLSAVVRWKVSDEASVLVTHDVQTKHLMMTDDELISIAMNNNNKQDVSIQPLGNVLATLMGAEGPDVDGVPVYVVKGEGSIWGSAAIVSPTIMEQISERICEDTGDQNLFIIPSSIFEVLVVGESFVEDPAFFQQTCSEVNNTIVDSQEQLSSNIYRYDGSTGAIRICNTIEDLQAQQHAAISNNQQLSTGRRM